MNDLTTQDWYTLLVDDCKSIITEAVFTSHWALVEGYHQLGARLVQDQEFQKYAKGNHEFLASLAKNIKISERTLYYCLKFYGKYDDLAKLPEGKNITWNKIITKYLPDNPEEKKSLEAIPEYHHRCPKCGYEW